MRMSCVALFASSVLALGACKSKEAAPSGGSAESPLPAKAKIDGPSVTPTITSGVTFVTPKGAAWWGEMNFSCYRAVMGLTGTKRAGEAFERLSPNVVPAMAAAGIDLGRDMAGIGGFDCSGSPCMYVVGRLDHPEKMGEVLKLLMPSSPPKDLGKGHYTLETPGIRGPRTVHVRVVPLSWSGDVPQDRWSHEAGQATHVIFLGGIDGKNVDLDPLASLADPATALATVKAAESVSANPDGRCVLGTVGPREFLPGFTLEKARFAIVAPEGTGTNDGLMMLMGSRRTLDVEVELTLKPAPTQADVDGWIAMGRGYLGGIGDSVRGQFAGQGELMDVYFDMLSLIGTKAFKNELKGNVLTFSWRTDRVPASDLTSIEKRLQAVMGTP